MKLLCNCIALLPCIFITTLPSAFSNINMFSLLNKNGDGGVNKQAFLRSYVQERSQESENNEADNDNYHFRMDPVLNSFRRYRRKLPRTKIKDREEKEYFRIDSELNPRRRLKISRRRGSSDEMSDTSSSREFRDWKDEFKEKWIQKKFEAVNSSYIPGDTVNMNYARPWGVPCGDPNQHDMPWGTCVLPMECDGEYRIYRGDHMCGRTQFVCCAMQLTAYDMYDGFDLSFEDTGLETDSQMKLGSKEDQKKYRQLLSKKRKDMRTKRRRKVQRKIKKIQKEIKHIITRQERNATHMRKQKTRQLKKFFDMLKDQYNKDRRGVADLHDVEMMKIDDSLMKMLEHISEINDNFVRNSTFRGILVNGTMDVKGARMLLEAYPDLKSHINLQVKRRSGGSVAQDPLNDDVEYGILYF